MNKKTSNTIISFIAAILVLILSGCTALKTFPQAARGGDTVALAVGSPDGMTRANTTAVFVSDSAPGAPVDITPGIRAIFRLYADEMSDVYNAGNDAQQIVLTSGHEPWVTIMGVDLPVGLPLGPGEVQVTTTATYPTIGSHINNLPIRLEILSGTGTSSDFTYEFGMGQSQIGDLQSLEPVPHAQVTPLFPHGTTWPSYAAVEIKMNVPTTLGTALDQPFLRVVLDNMTVQTGSTPSLIYNHDSSEELTVILVSPDGQLKYFQPRFSIALIDNPFLPVSFIGIPAVTSVKYYDINGNQVSGPMVGDFSVEVR